MVQYLDGFGGSTLIDAGTNPQPDEEISVAAPSPASIVTGRLRTWWTRCNEQHRWDLRRFPCNRKGGHEMITGLRNQRIRVALGFLLAAIVWAWPPLARAAWVTSCATQFQVVGKLAEIVPTLVSTAPGIANSPPLVDPTCGSQGGTSLALVRGFKLAGVDPILYPIVLVVSCLDNGGGATTRARLNFINPIPFSVSGTNVNVAAGTVVKQLTTTIIVNGAVVAFAPSNGWAHLVH